MIEVHDIRKEFKTPVVKEGRFSGSRTLFTREYRTKEAVKGISFQVEQGNSSVTSDRTGPANPPPSKC